jgi:methylmalonyl-CoA carboxyltransferase 12S subunit
MTATENVATLLEEMNDRLRGMEERIRNLEVRLGGTVKPAVSAPAPVPVPAAPKEEEIEPEVLMVIAAAVAAFMGQKARIRRVRRSATPGMNPWAQQGRVSIQASHSVR